MVGRREGAAVVDGLRLSSDGGPGWAWKRIVSEVRNEAPTPGVAPAAVVYGRGMRSLACCSGCVWQTLSSLRSASLDRIDFLVELVLLRSPSLDDRRDPHPGEAAAVSPLVGSVVALSATPSTPTSQSKGRSPTRSGDRVPAEGAVNGLFESVAAGSSATGSALLLQSSCPRPPSPSPPCSAWSSAVTGVGSPCAICGNTSAGVAEKDDLVLAGVEALSTPLLRHPAISWEPAPACSCRWVLFTRCCCPPAERGTCSSPKTRPRECELLRWLPLESWKCLQLCRVAAVLGRYAATKPGAELDLLLLPRPGARSGALKRSAQDAVVTKAVFYKSSWTTRSAMVQYTTCVTRVISLPILLTRGGIRWHTPFHSCPLSFSTSRVPGIEMFTVD